MADTMESRLAKVRAYSDSAKRRASLYGDIAGMGGRRTSKSLGALRNAPAPGKKLQKIGFIMLWIPEPTGATCAVGAPMILAGRYLDRKYNSATISDVGSQAKANASAITGFKKTIM